MMRTTEDFVNEINERDKKLSHYEGLCRELCLYLKDYCIFPPDMTEKDKELYYQFKGHKPDWSMFMQLWSHYLTETWKDYREALIQS